MGETIKKIPLYFKPGTMFGYSIGHRLLGWMLLDYWRAQPEGAGFRELNDVFKFLVYDPLNLSPGTYFIKDTFDCPHSIMGEFFDMRFFDIEDDVSDDDPADLSMASTGADMMKLAMVALRRGQLPNGSWYIPREKWNKWAAINKLPGGKLSKALAFWRMKGYRLFFKTRTTITRDTNAGPFGWSYFGATYHNYEGDGNAGEPVAVGWKGFSSCGLRADYAQNIAFVGMQECVPDPGGRNFAECIHQGKVGDYSLGFVGRQLALMDAGAMENARNETTPPFNPLHEVMMELDDPPCCVSCIQNQIRHVFGFSLPMGVSMIDFHIVEKLDTADSLRDELHPLKG